MLEIVTNNAADTRKLGETFAALLKTGDTVYLSGELGTGKTVFVQGAARGLGYIGNVTSPTFTLIHEYRAPTTIYHLDCFRIRTPEDFLSLGIDDYIGENSLLFVEWADLIEDYFNQWCYILQLSFVDIGENLRRICFSVGNNLNSPHRLNQLRKLIDGFKEAAL